MAEAFGALGLAANILQFTECGFRIARTMRELKDSTDGAIASNRELELLAVDLGKTMACVNRHAAFQGTPELLSCVGACTQLSGELVKLLGSLKCDNPRSTAWRRIRGVVKIQRKAGDVERLEERLARLRGQICDHANLRLLFELATQGISASSSRDQVIEELRALSVNVAKLAEIKDWGIADGKSSPGDFDRFTDFVAKFSSLAEAFPQEYRISRFLDTLSFWQIQERHATVSDAHPATFQWIYGSFPRANLASWMTSQDNNGIYWVSGKAGSGKSTLMKFLVKERRTREVLEHWAGTRHLIIASHFFWSAGTPLQKTQEGLLRTILSQIMSQDTELIPLLCPDRWEQPSPPGPSSRMQEPWSRDNLYGVLKDLAGLPNYNRRVCLFIDGLDEYQGDHRELLSLLQAFEDAQWKLKLQDLTRDDIRKYTMDILCPEQPKYPWLKVHDRAVASSLVEEICDRAQGVFLWVFLVARSLSRGLANGDSMADLRARLMELPVDLEEYFAQMLDTIDQVYRPRAARALLTLAHTTFPMRLLFFHFFDLEEHNPDYAVGQELSLEPPPESKQTPADDAQAVPSHNSQSTVLAIEHYKRTQLVAQCKDLVCIVRDPDITGPGASAVTLLHRTVYDFLRTETIETLLRSWIKGLFEPRLTLSRAFLATLKATPDLCLSLRGSVRTLGTSVDALIAAIMVYTREMEGLGLEGESWKILGHIDRNDPGSLSPRKMNSVYGLPSLKMGSQTFLELLARYSSYHYLEKAIPRLGDAAKAKLLWSVVDSVQIVIKGEQGWSLGRAENANLETVELLLRLGISPNAVLQSSSVDDKAAESVWSRYLGRLAGRLRDTTAVDFQICWLMMKHGADVGAAAPDSKDRADVRGILEKKFGQDKAVVLIQLGEETSRLAGGPG
ncbi:hypothetical protein OQA88_7671 [Cercophora sp. LCS_1]